MGDVLLIGQVQERVALALLLHLLVGPPVPRLLLLQRLLLLLVQPNIDPAQQERDEKLDRQQDHDGGLARDVRGGILGLEDLCSDDVADAESDEGNGIDGVLGVTVGERPRLRRSTF